MVIGWMVIIPTTATIPSPDEQWRGREEGAMIKSLVTYTCMYSTCTCMLLHLYMYMKTMQYRKERDLL